MNKINIKFKKLNKNAKIPIYGTKDSAGFDFYALDNYTIPAGKVLKIPSGLAFEFPKEFCLSLVSRSGLAIKGIYHIESIIDSDYRGEIHLILLNTTESDFHIEKGDRLAQGIMTPAFRAKFTEVKELSETERGTGGFHSTGRK